MFQPFFHCFRVCFNHSFIVSAFVSTLFHCFRVCFYHFFSLVSTFFHCFSGWQEGKQSASVTGHFCRNGKTRTATTRSLTTCGKTNAFPKRRTWWRPWTSTSRWVIFFTYLFIIIFFLRDFIFKKTSIWNWGRLTAFFGHDCFFFSVKIT